MHYHYFNLILGLSVLAIPNTELFSEESVTSPIFTYEETEVMTGANCAAPIHNCATVTQEVVARPAVTIKKIILVGNESSRGEEVEPSSNDLAAQVEGEKAPIQEEGEVVFRDIAVPGDQQLLIDKIYDKFIAQELTEETLPALRKTIEQYYIDAHHPMVTINFPPQEITGGELVVNVTESRVSNVVIVDGSYTSPKLLKDYIGVKESDTLNTTELRKNLDFMNRNPFRSVNMIYVPGEKENTTDVVLNVNDRKPVRMYVGTDDSGVETTQRGRVFGGINVSELFTVDSFLTVQWTASYDMKSFQAGTGEYILYLPWKHVLDIYGGYSVVHTKTSFPGSKSWGHSGQASLRYEVPLDPINGYVHSLAGGLDYKRTNNNISFAELFPVVANNINLSQFMGRYTGSYEKGSLRAEVNAEMFFSPCAMLPEESDARYNSLRPGATNQWVYGRLMAKYVQKLPKSFLLFITGRGQLSTGALIPSEQLGLGGYDTIRGYDERQLSYDNGAILNIELMTPAISGLGWKDSKSNSALQFLAFFDFGYGGNNKLMPGEKKTDYLMGAGPAIRYTFDPWVTARLDLGWKLHQQATFTGGNAMWYFSFIANI